MRSLVDFAVLVYSIVGIGLMAQGLRYLMADHIMHYHTEVMRVRWSEVKPEEQRLMLGLLRGFGAGMFCFGVMITFSAVVPLRQGAVLAEWFLAFISILYTAMLVYVTRMALLPGAPPIIVTVTMCACCVAAAAASIVAMRI